MRLVLLALALLPINFVLKMDDWHLRFDTVTKHNLAGSKPSACMLICCHSNVILNKKYNPGAGTFVLRRTNDTI